MNELTKEERLRRARNKIKLMRRNIDDSRANQLKLRELVREYVRQRPEVCIKIIQDWLN